MKDRSRAALAMTPRRRCANERGPNAARQWPTLRFSPAPPRMKPSDGATAVYTVEFFKVRPLSVLKKTLAEWTRNS